MDTQVFDLAFNYVTQFDWHHLHPNPSSMVLDSSFYINNSTDIQVWLTSSRFFCYTTGSLLVISVGRANVEVADRLGDSESTMGLQEQLDKGPSITVCPTILGLNPGCHNQHPWLGKRLGQRLNRPPVTPLAQL
ncbi:hypothetical protein PGT21_014824 [Puccinia graminis f. sp. tritici]|uniref:Uncharacterized protein n=1 Tax=Puccinia graminis f. sp. tritici TaxID=56615 RepID=A0A5B0Q2T4_PUCGR|nr:hypothetical protein PGT21_014824 [Puccinia graminis f. sp. tritici]KAA1124726.1 hypothetical protein PGTUg99_032869 [Puccinia graminis f. sp. tritici]